MSPIGGLSDRELVLAFQAGGSDAYDEVYRRHSDRVHRVCLRMLGNQQDAEEATQETFLKAYQALPRFNGQFQLGAWLARIAANVCVDHLRVRARSHLVALPDGDQVRELESGPEELVVGDHPRLDVALNSVQPLHAQALALRALEGLSHREMAGRLKMSPDQVKALLHRARVSLRKAWDKAEGWALAPLLAFRSASDRSGSTNAGPVVSVAPQVPYFVEKFATSAVIVVVALTGVPAGSGSAPSEMHPSQTVTSPEVAQKDDLKPALPTKVESAAPARSTTEEAAPAKDLAGDLVATIQATVTSSKKNGGGGGNDDDDDDPLGGDAQAAAQSVVRETKDTVNETVGEIQDLTQ